ncbi:MAG: pilus assembly protein PilM [Planctomycetaceae bacterium]|jgi:hypothetical protein|nr:pilus assembly protein PilM [Planctomycetaceae bacterium]
MAIWVAITWEQGRFLFLSASTSGKAVTFEHAAELDDPKQLDELIARLRLAKAETIVILNRSDVEVRPMVFPPVPLDELPDLVKFQAGKEFNHYDPNAPVDFFVTNKLENVSRSTLFPAVKATGSAPAPDGSPKHLLASTLRLQVFQKIKSFCDEHNLVLRHIVLRPCTTAALWRHSGNFQTSRSALLVELDDNEAAQTVVFQGEPVFMRSPKIVRPQDVSVPDFAARIIAELKRTRIAVRNEINGIDVDEVVLCGSGAKFESLAEQLSQGLETSVRLFDPLKGLTIKAKGADEQYAALFGAVQQVVRKETFQIDFFNPKKREEDTSKRNLFTAIAAVVFLLVLSLFGYVIHARMTLEKDVNKLDQRFKTLQETAGTVVAQKKQLDEIDKWLADDVDWFQQLGWLSEKALPSQDMMIRGLEFSSASKGTIRFTALLRDPSLVSQMEEGFRDSLHVPQPGNINAEPPGNSRYRSRRDMIIRLSKTSVLPVRTEKTPLPQEPGK